MADAIVNQTRSIAPGKRMIAFGHRLKVRGTSRISDDLVGAVGFELTTPCAQGRCATRLRYAPTLNDESFDHRRIRTHSEKLNVRIRG